MFLDRKHKQNRILNKALDHLHGHGHMIRKKLMSLGILWCQCWIINSHELLNVY